MREGLQLCGTEADEMTLPLVAPLIHSAFQSGSVELVTALVSFTGSKVLQVTDDDGVRTFCFVPCPPL